MFFRCNFRKLRRTRRERLFQLFQIPLCVLFLMLWLALTFLNGRQSWSRYVQQQSMRQLHHSPDATEGLSKNSPSSSFHMTSRAEEMDHLEEPLGRKGVYFSAIGATRVKRLGKSDVMVNLKAERDVNRTLCPIDPNERERPALLEFLNFFTKVFQEKFDNLPWMIDEGGLIGVGRAGAISDADDDFDFFAILPNSIAPCRPDSLDCTEEEFNIFIHRFLMPFWDAGACIHHFDPDLVKFHSNRRLMYSFQLNRKPNIDPQTCFKHNAPLAHMHLGMLNADGELETNKWVNARSSHKKDKLPLDLLLPVRRCRMGPLDAPCPNDLIGFLSKRNAGEYVRRSSNGRCLLVRKQWSMKRKQNQVNKVQLLHQCGYNSMVGLVEPFIKSGYTSC